MKQTVHTEVNSIEELEMLIRAVRGMNKPFDLRAAVSVEIENIFAMPAPNPAIDAAVEAAQAKIDKSWADAANDAPTNDDPEIPTRAFMLDLLKRASAQLGKEKVEQMLVEHGGKRLSEIHESKWAQVHAQLTDVMYRKGADADA